MITNVNQSHSGSGDNVGRDINVIGNIINVGGADKPNSGNSLCDFFSQSPSFKNLSKFFL